MKNLTPRATWDFLQRYPESLLVDVRMEIEALYVGSPPGAVNVPWYEYPDLTPDPADFVAKVAEQAGGSTTRPIVLICRSGARTVLAGQALEAAGFTDVTNVLFGFEGDANDEFQRSTINGWRYEGLPWSQS